MKIGKETWHYKIYRGTFEYEWQSRKSVSLSRYVLIVAADLLFSVFIALPFWAFFTLVYNLVTISFGVGTWWWHKDINTVDMSMKKFQTSVRTVIWSLWALLAIGTFVNIEMALYCAPISVIGYLIATRRPTVTFTGAEED